MSTSNPIDLLFGGMSKLGPGGDVHTRRVLQLLPRNQFGIVVDAGCGAGRQTLVLAKELATLVHAVDSYEPFLNHLKQQANDAGVWTLCTNTLHGHEGHPDRLSASRFTVV
jgi:methylase of polypeptide subunit release factors